MSLLISAKTLCETPAGRKAGNVSAAGYKLKSEGTAPEPPSLEIIRAVPADTSLLRSENYIAVARNYTDKERVSKLRRILNDVMDGKVDLDKVDPNLKLWFAELTRFLDCHVGKGCVNERSSKVNTFTSEQRKIADSIIENFRIPQYSPRLPDVYAVHGDNQESIRELLTERWYRDDSSFTGREKKILDSLEPEIVTSNTRDEFYEVLLYLDYARKRNWFEHDFEGLFEDKVKGLGGCSRDTLNLTIDILENAWMTQKQQNRFLDFVRNLNKYNGQLYSTFLVQFIQEEQLQLPRDSDSKRMNEILLVELLIEAAKYTDEAKLVLESLPLQSPISKYMATDFLQQDTAQQLAV